MVHSHISLIMYLLCDFQFICTHVLVGNKYVFVLQVLCIYVYSSVSWQQLIGNLLRCMASPQDQGDTWRRQMCHRIRVRLDMYRNVCTTSRHISNNSGTTTTLAKMTINYNLTRNSTCWPAASTGSWNSVCCRRSKFMFDTKTFIISKQRELSLC